jgi:tetratricopeptide (TPR) repeat protein
VERNQKAGFEKVSIMVEEEKEELGDAIKEFNRGLDSHIEGKLDASLKHFLIALPTFQEFGVEDMIAGTFHELGMILQDMGQLDEALDYYQKSLVLSEKLKYNPGCEKTLFQMGTIYEIKGDIITAEEYFRKSKQYKVKKPSGLKFIIVVFIFAGLYCIGTGLLGISGSLKEFTPQLISPALWNVIVSVLTTLSPFLIILGFFAILAGAGLQLLKGWRWVLGIFTSLLMVISIAGIIFYWYLSRENIQELYQVK